MARTAVVGGIAAFALAAAGCGKADPESEVRKTVEGFASAVAERDYQALCDTYFSRTLVSGLERAGLPCEAAIRPEIGQTDKPVLEIRSIEVDGDRAKVSVHTTAANQAPSDDTLALVREQDDRWRIISLAETGPQPAAP